MNSINLNDATNECLNNPNCHMFYNYGGNGYDFRYCKVTASVKASSTGDILYRRLGNKTYSLVSRDILQRHYIILYVMN